MKRTQKIEALIQVGFSATELSRSSNELLDKTYESAKPLMAAKDAEVRRVMGRENARGRALKQRLEATAAQQRASEEWSQKWVHPAEQYPLSLDAESVTRREMRATLKTTEARHSEYKAIFKRTGDHSYADKANEAAATLRFLREELATGVE